MSLIKSKTAISPLKSNLRRGERCSYFEQSSEFDLASEFDFPSGEQEGKFWWQRTSKIVSKFAEVPPPTVRTNPLAFINKRYKIAPQCY